jgi:hypothetical protein
MTDIFNDGRMVLTVGEDIQMALPLPGKRQTRHFIFRKMSW